MDNLENVDDALKKKEWPRATILIILIGIAVVWLSFKDAISGKDQAEREAAIKLEQVHAFYAKKIDSLNTNWTILYNIQVDGRMRDKDENIKLLREKDEKYSNAAIQYYTESKATRIRTERNNKKIKVVESVINPVKK
ncbi:hypothetical protein MUK70_11785 [Dyadobacter chenwenxiniae]|uniref:Uncharacterized protein n=1 Tax=Dyadobacter chenwenxiniae TaxID=2906456 RepID=A0A9X1TCC4_9BACT|nr:hypothetical protein [Dyadobacter chenwenxiniae]MCF0059922.1 hypothetical protein [Dyadobacter chenwenxiniae]UON85661.1 hypothetical protein MUK70_11785 [Dyadobacter chenwenxiniae]